MDLLPFLAEALTPFNLMLALVGVVLGTLIGALPGLSATMAVAVLVPFTFAMPPASGLIALGAIYTGAIYGGAFAAILVNTPGTPSAIATTFDGYPMAKRGDGNLAVTLATLASVTGGLVGALALLFLSPPLSTVALAFGPPEYFWLALFGLTLISALSQGDTLKGLIGAGFGLFLSTIGIAVVGGDVRYTLDQPLLVGGIDVIAALIGLYCIPVLIDLVARPDPHLRVSLQAGGFRLGEAMRIYAENWFNVIRSSVIGTVVGILPGAGGSIASLVAYSEARRTAKHPERYGTGEAGGILATESANNATVGGGFIPTLVLGIPGTPPDAVILGALLVQGIRTGPALFTGQGDIVFTFIFGLLIATILMLPVGLLIGRYAYQAIIAIPKAVLVPAVAFLTVIGSFAIHNSIHDVYTMLTLGFVGWTLARFGFAPSPIVLGVILGSIAEQGFVQGWLIGNAAGNVWGMFFGRPISLAIVALAALTLLYPVVVQASKNRRARIVPSLADQGAALPAVVPAGDADARPAPKRDLGTIVLCVAFIALGLWMITGTAAMSVLGAVFPRVIAGILIVSSLAVLFLQGIGRPGPVVVAAHGSTPRRFLLCVALTLWALALPRLGFFATSFVGFLALLAIAEYDRWTAKRVLAYIASAIAFVGGFYLLFVEVLLVSVPRGLLF